MRFSSISFTHASTAMFGLAVAGYAALRMAGYDVPHDPAHLASPAPSIVDRAPHAGQPVSRSAQRDTGREAHVALHPQLDPGDRPRTHGGDETQHGGNLPTDSQVASPAWSRDATEWRKANPTPDAAWHEDSPDATWSGTTDAGEPDD